MPTPYDAFANLSNPNTNIDYSPTSGTIDPAVTDSSAVNFGSAFSSPGSLSSTNLAGAPSTTDLSALGGTFGTSQGPTDSQGVPYSLYAPQANPNSPQFNPNWTPPGTTASPTSDPLAALNDPNYFTSGGQSATGTPYAPATTQPVGSPATGAPATDWSKLLGSAGQTALGLAPSLIAGGIGLSQAKSAQNENTAFANQLQALGGPYTAAGQQLLKQFQSGQIRPDQQKVADLATSQGQSLIDSGAGLSSIAQAAYKDYQAGKLPPADEQRLADQTAAQKQELRQRLAGQGITDSSILAGYDQQIENQANINRQDLLDQRFATGNTAYDQWLKSTEAGQQLKLEGAQFASKSLDDMLTQSLNLGQEGMAPITQAIELKMQSDAALSAQVQQLMGNLAGAYAYGKTGGQVPGGGAPGTAAAALGTASSALGVAGKAVGGGGAPSTGYTSGLGTGAQAPSNAMDPNYFNASQQQPIYDASGNPVTSSGATDPLAALNDPNYFGTSNIQPISDPSSPPSAAGGEAATVGGSGTGAALGMAGAGLGIAAGLAQGTPTGYAKAGLGATQLAGKAGLVSPQVNATAGTMMNALGIYSGIKQGGVAGYSGAGVNAAQLGAKAGAFGGASGAVGTAAGYAAIPLSLYNEVTTWQSGATGSDALAGAETGAAIGSVVPVVGTFFGAVIGGIAGAVSSLFGSGKKGVAAANWDQLTKSNALKSVAGRDFTTHSWSEAFKGMLDEGNNIFAGGGKDRHKDPDALAKPLEAQVKSGMAKLGPNATTDQVYNQVIVPWMQSKGSGLNWNVLKNEPQQQLMIKSAVDRVLAGEPIVRSEMQSASPTPQSSGQSLMSAIGGGRR